MKQIPEFERCAVLLGALAEPIRLRIVNCLFGGPKNVTDICSLLDEEIVNVSHHLKVLKNAKVLTSKKQGRFVVYQIHPDFLAADKESRERKQIDFGCCQVNLSAHAKHCDD